LDVIELVNPGVLSLAGWRLNPREDNVVYQVTWGMNSENDAFLTCGDAYSPNSLAERPTPPVRGPGRLSGALTRLLVDEPTQLDRGLLTLDVEHIKSTGPPVEPARGRPRTFGQVGFLILVGGVVGNELER
jgi:hypothetical protein